MNIATLVLEDGSVVDGQAFGGATDTVFQVVFNRWVDDATRRTLKSLLPETYIGLAIKLTDKLVSTVT